MKGFELLLTLREDCVFSERSATEGGHRGLNFVPGASILGAFAARLYPDTRLSPEDKFWLFHSGRVRFGNGLPVSDAGERGWPMPFCWHHDKGARWLIGKDQIDQDAVFHPAPNDGNRNVQPEQLRGDFVTETGKLLKPEKSLRLKTAIDPATARAREGALFGYDALRAGQRFVARIAADDTVEGRLYSALRAAVPSPMPLGRSRSAEYGLVDVEIEDLAVKADARIMQAGGWTDAEDLAIGQTRIALWLISDLVATDDLGQPTLLPKPRWLGLPDGELNTARSFLRSRRYSPWNAHRGGPDLERQVLCQGSLLVFDLHAPLQENHRKRLAAGLGLHRETGLGQVWLNPALLGKPGHSVPAFAADPPEDCVPAIVPANDKAPASDLLTWLTATRKQSTGRDAAADKAREIASRYPALLRSARRLQGLPATAEVGPSHSQWGAVLAMAKRPPAEFADALFDLQKGPCKPSAPGWKDACWDTDAKELQSFSCWLLRELGHAPSPEVVQRLAREIMHRIKQEAPR